MIAEVDDAQIRKLLSEAGQAGDLAMCRICERALDDDEAARRVCADIISQVDRS